MLFNFYLKYFIEIKYIKINLFIYKNLCYYIIYILKYFYNLLFIIIKYFININIII